MDIEKYIKKDINYYNSGTEDVDLRAYEKRKNLQLVVILLNNISKITTGILGTKIHFDYYKCGYNKKNKIFDIQYNTTNGEYYQYNRIETTEDYKITLIKGTHNNLIQKIFDLIDLLDEDLINQYKHIIDIVEKAFIPFKERKSIYNYEIKCYEQKEIFDYDYIKTNETISKIDELDNIHGSLLLYYSNENIINILKELILVWEIDNFNIIKGKYIEGSFSNSSIPTYNYLKKVNRTLMINFPDGGRGSLCTDFLAVSGFENIKEKEIIRLQNSRKNSKVKEYEFLQKSCDGYLAVRNLKTNTIEFLADIRDVEIAYNGLFKSNKAEFRGWFNKRVEYIIN